MPKVKRACLVTTSAVAFAGLLAASALRPAEAQQRKSLRRATSQVGSYGYMIALPLQPKSDLSELRPV